MRRYHSLPLLPVFFIYISIHSSSSYFSVAVRSRCKLDNGDKMVKVLIQLAFNQQMPSPIEKCEILASLNG